MVKMEEITYITRRYNELHPLGKEVCRIVERSGIKGGIVHVITKHTTTGITVNECLECLEDDILGWLGNVFPEDGFYYHARFLDSYGAMAGNPTGHLKAMVTGNHASFPVVDKKVLLGSAQEVYLAEFDGPQERTVTVTVIGE